MTERGLLSVDLEKLEQVKALAEKLGTNMPLLIWANEAESSRRTRRGVDAGVS